MSAQFRIADIFGQITAHNWPEAMNPHKLKDVPPDDRRTKVMI
jgi:hypothetical protein